MNDTDLQAKSASDQDPIIRVIDFEATGLEPDALICEYGWTDINVRTREIGETISSLCRVDTMPPGARAVHHIRPEDTAGYPPYDRRCLFESAALAGVYAWAAHSAEFEGRYIGGQLPMFCTNKGAMRLWPEAPGHSVFALLYWLEDAGKVAFDRTRAYPPHRAGPDSYATAVLLKAMLDEGVSGRMLWDWTAQPRLFPRCPIGKYRGMEWADVPWSFLDWIMRTIQDDPDIRFSTAIEMERREYRND